MLTEVLRQTAFHYVLAIFIAMACGYLLGSLNGAIASVRLLKGKDIREYGSKNAGLTNTLRCFGKGCGILTLVIDIGKGMAAIALVNWIVERLAIAPLPDGTGTSSRWLCYICAVFAIIGHMFPLYHHFHGGKGVLVGVSTFLIINPLTFLILMAIFGLVLWCWKYVSIASVTATICVIPVTFLLEWMVRGTTLGMAMLYTLMATCMAALIVWCHRENLKRVSMGTEWKLGTPRSKDTNPQQNA